MRAQWSWEPDLPFLPVHVYLKKTSGQKYRKCHSLVQNMVNSQTCVGQLTSYALRIQRAIALVECF